MTKQEIIGQWAEGKLVERIVEKVTRKPIEDYYKDFCQLIYLALLEKDDKTIQGLQATNSEAFYVARMVLNQVKSNRSPLYTEYIAKRRECTENLEKG